MGGFGPALGIAGIGLDIAGRCTLRVKGMVPTNWSFNTTLAPVG